MKTSSAVIAVVLVLCSGFSNTQQARSQSVALSAEVPSIEDINEQASGIPSVTSFACPARGRTAFRIVFKGHAGFRAHQY